MVTYENISWGVANEEKNEEILNFSLININPYHIPRHLQAFHTVLCL